MALKNMIKLGDKVTFGRAGDTKKPGKVVKLNPKTAHIKLSNGEVMSVTYNLIQKPSKKKRSPSKKTRRGPFKIEQQGLSKWAIWEDTGDSWTLVTGSFDSQKEAADMVRKWGGRISRKNPAPYKFGAASKKLRKATKQDDDWGDPAAFATTHPDEYEERTTQERFPGQTRPNPATFTKKGERLYEHIKEGYGHDPRAKEIAARTVYKISRSTPGLVKKRYRKNPYGSFARGGAAPTRRPTTTKYSLWLQEQSKGQLNKLEKALTVLVDNNPGAVQGLQQKLSEVRRELSHR